MASYNVELRKRTGNTYGDVVKVATDWSLIANKPNTFTPTAHTHSYAPINHASTATTYGLGTTANYGHVKTINALTQSSHADGTSLSAYQGYLLNTNKAPNSHASSAATYGLGTPTVYGHVKTINNLLQSSYASGEALSAYQGYLLNTNKADSSHTHDVDEIEPVLTTVTAHTYSNNLKPNSTVVFDSASNLYCYLDNIADTGTYQNQWQIGDTLTVIRLGMGYVRMVDSAGTLYVNNEGTPQTGGYSYLPRYTAVTCVMVGGTTSSTNWVILGATSTSSAI